MRPLRLRPGALELPALPHLGALDDAARRIVQMASPYAAFPAAIRADYDRLEITRTLTFTNSNQLESRTR